jgi:hypothetical protein
MMDGALVNQGPVRLLDGRKTFWAGLRKEGLTGRPVFISLPTR